VVDAVAVEHLRESDPVMLALIDQIGIDSVSVPRPDRPSDHYGTLVRSIVGQQLSTKAARSIWMRLIERYGGQAPTPEQVLADDPDAMRMAAGLSRAKVVYLRSLAEHVQSGDLKLDRLSELPDDEVIAELVAVKGLGVWSAHMFLMFHLERPDVLPTGDLGIRRAIMLRYGLDTLPEAAEIETIAEPWQPYRTLACRYLWRSLDNTPVESE
jgi:DNA-3-methyladenine glycosylase II